MRLRIAIVLVAISLLLIVWVVWERLDPSPIQEALEVLEEQDRFRTATESGLAFARVASLMKRAGEECESEGELPTRCEALFTASATAHVTAATVLRCTRPGIFDARRQMIPYLQALEDGRDPQPPGVPRCD